MTIIQLNLPQKMKEEILIKTKIENLKTKIYIMIITLDLNLVNDNIDNNDDELNFGVGPINPSMGIFERNRNFNYNRHDDEFKLKVDIPNLNGDLDIEVFLDWLTKVDIFFEHTKLFEDKKVKFVAYRLREMKMRGGHGPVQTWRRMKQLL